MITTNERLKKENDKYEIDNEKLNKNIIDLIQRIDISTLLKEIDMDEIELLAQNNEKMQMAFKGLLNHLDRIHEQEELI